MVSHGDLPTIDFGYNYGLLPILVGHWWFAVFGSSAVGYQVGMVACNVLAAIGIAAVLTALNVGLVGVILTILTLGFAVQSTYPNLSQALEAVLLITAIAQQSRGANSAALVFGLIGILAKPAMGYPYSLLLIVIIAGQLVRAGSSAEVWIKSFAPAVIFFLVLGLVLSATSQTPTVYQYHFTHRRSRELSSCTLWFLSRSRKRILGYYGSPLVGSSLRYFWFLDARHCFADCIRAI